ncbi:PTS sugar transporter subunit IIA [Gracilibacillus phocaeensis]|uniref:PTS sugar transporter subunit IIA n=1 Tax=Gracilibacillus phocaeensis TaxID=2042304 RepID=UPI0010324FDC|nr:PTS glucose transporter subunit IIA [Gracilibacillus phocaeensis]
MFKKLFQKSDEIEIIAPMSGEIVLLEKVPDPVFAEKMMGEGVAIIPSEGNVVAPINGKVIQVPDSKHAIGLEAEDGTEVLIHVGLETVGLKGQGFSPKVKPGDRVTIGTSLLEVDLSYISEYAANTITPIVITNSNTKDKTYKTTTETNVTAGETVILSIS